MIDSILKITHGCGFDEAIKIKDGETLEVGIRKENGERLELLRLPHVSVGDDGWREECEPVLIRVMVDVAKGGRFETEETKRKAAIEEEREACAKIADELEFKQAYCYWQAVADDIAEQIRARGGE